MVFEIFKDNRMSDFGSVCNKILNCEDDINVVGLKELHEFLILLLENSSEYEGLQLDGYEISVSGNITFFTYLRRTNFCVF